MKIFKIVNSIVFSKRIKKIEIACKHFNEKLKVNDEKYKLYEDNLMINSHLPMKLVDKRKKNYDKN